MHRPKRKTFSTLSISSGKSRTCISTWIVAPVRRGLSRVGYAKGYVLIEYATLKEAKKALDGMDNQQILGKKVRVDWAFKRPPMKAK